uniref:Uncharacterized protein n=1 Tax=Oryza barthii TaxID=65489 RepID=A0A0D3FJU9_9ORYZ
MPGTQGTGWYLGIRPWYQGIKPDTYGVSEGTVKKRRRGGGSAATAEDGVKEARRGEGRVPVGTWYLVPLVPTRYRSIPDARYLRYRVSNLGTKVSSLILVGYQRVLSKKSRRCGGGRAATADDGVEEARRDEGRGPSQRAREVSRRRLTAIPVAGRRGLPTSIPEAQKRQAAAGTTGRRARGRPRRGLADLADVVPSSSSSAAGNDDDDPFLPAGFVSARPSSEREREEREREGCSAV